MQLVEEDPGRLLKRSLFKRKTILMSAVKGGNVLTISTLLWAAEAHLDDDGSSSVYHSFVNAADVFGNTALHVAARCGANTSTVSRILIEEGLNALSANKRGNTPLHLACAYGNAACAEVILDSRVRGGDGRMVMASQAYVRDRIGETKYIDALNHSGLSSLHLATMACSPMTALVLVGRGAQLDCGVARGLDRFPYLCGGSTPLHISASLGDVHTCLILLEAQSRYPGLELRRMRNIVGLTPLNCALLSGHHNVIRVLIDTPRRERLLGSSSLNINGNLSSVAQFPSSLREHMLGVLRKAQLLVLLRDIALYWEKRGVGKESDSRIMQVLGISNISLTKVHGMKALLEDEDASLRDVLSGFERALHGAKPETSLGISSSLQTNGAVPQIVTKDPVHDVEDCPICMDDLMEVQFEGCGHSLCFSCASSLCMKPKDSIQCPFCRGDVDGISVLACARVQ